MLQVHTRGGLFGPGGYGGGIFDGSQMGFGGLGQYEQAAAGIRGIGDIGPGGGFKWCSKSEPCATADPRVVTLQKAFNTALVRHGFKALTVDGKVGPATCGAWAWSGTLPQNDPFYSIAGLMELMQQFVAGGSNICKTSTYPTSAKTGQVFIPPNTFKAVLPWQEINPQARTVQNNLNNDLTAHGYLPIAESGMLDAPTCGAMKLAKEQWGMDYLSQYGADCQAFQTPQMRPAPMVPVTPVPGPEPKEETVFKPVKKTGVSAAWMIGGLAVAAGVAGLYAASKKR